MPGREGQARRHWIPTDFQKCAPNSVRSLTTTTPAHNHRDAPPGTAVKYGNGEIETIESLVDIGHFEVQVTPDNCSASLISVDQIVQDGYTVTLEIV